MIVPVIHSKIRREETKGKVGVSLLTHNLMVLSSLLKFSIIQEDLVSMQQQERTIACGIYQGDKLVSNEVQVLLDSTDPAAENRIHNIQLTLKPGVAPGLLQLRICDVKDRLNMLAEAPVKNNTLIDQDF